MTSFSATARRSFTIAHYSMPVAFVPCISTRVSERFRFEL